MLQQLTAENKNVGLTMNISTTKLITNKTELGALGLKDKYKATTIRSITKVADVKVKTPILK